MDRSSTSRVVALAAGAAIIVGSIGPWETTFIVDVSGTEGDGILTLLMGIAATALVAIRRPPSRWLIVAVILGIICSIVGIYDWINVQGSTQELLGQEVRLVGVGWGLWLTPIASVVFTISAWLFAKEKRPEATPGEGVAPAPAPTSEPASPPPGWYQDRSDRGSLRWWDGTRWTDHVAPVVQAPTASRIAGESSGQSGS